MDKSSNGLDSGLMLPVSVVIGFILTVITAFQMGPYLASITTSEQYKGIGMSIGFFYTGVVYLAFYLWEKKKQGKREKTYE